MQFDIDGIIEVVVWGVAALVLLPYTIGPVLVYFIQKMPARTGFRRIHVLDARDDDALTPESEAFLKTTIAAFQELGFDVRGLMHAGEEATGGQIRTTLALFEEPRSGDLALAAAMFGKANDRWTLQSKHVEISSRFADGREVETGNAEVLNPLPRLPHKRVESFPGLADLGRLLRLHREIVRDEGLASAARARLPADAAPVTFIQDDMERGFEAQVPTGYLFRDPAAPETFRPTAKGALLMTWKLLPPASWIAKSRRRARADELMRAMPA